MHKVWMISILSFFTLSLSAQQKSRILKEDTTIYSAVEIQPQFPGGEAALGKYLMNIRIPENVKNNFTSRVLMCWIVEKNGKLSHVSILNSIPVEEQATMLNLIKSMPRWSPGVLNRKIVRVKVTIPLTIDITE